MTFKLISHFFVFIILQLKENVLNTVPIQYLLQIKLEAYQSRHAGGVRCGECIARNKVVGFCITCSLSMCKACSKYHQGQNKYKNHVIKQATGWTEEQLLQGFKKYCDLHANELRYFCSDCKVRFTFFY